MPKVLAIIPARLESTRFPRKLLADRTGKTLLQHVVEEAQAAKDEGIIADFAVATGDREIAMLCREWFVDVYETGGALNGTHRASMAAWTALKYRQHYDMFAVWQADEVYLNREDVKMAIQSAVWHTSSKMTTICCQLGPEATRMDPNTVKVCITVNNQALFFSREPISSLAQPDKFGPWQQHIGFYLYHEPSYFLHTIPTVYTTPAYADLARIHGLEQLAIIARGDNVNVCRTAYMPSGINTREDYDAFARLCIADPHWKANSRNVNPTPGE